MNTSLENVELWLNSFKTKQFTKEEFNNVLASDEHIDMINIVISGRYEQFFTLPLLHDLLYVNYSDLSNIELVLYDKFLNYLNNAERNEVLSCLVVYLFSLSSLQLFVQSNWTGPKAQNCILLMSENEIQRDLINSRVSEILSLNGEPCNASSEHLSYLFFAKFIYDNFIHLIEKYFKTCKLWKMRTLWIHQCLFHEKIISLQTQLLLIIEETDELQIFILNEKFSEIAMQFHIEASQICYFYYKYLVANDHIEKAEKISKLEVSLTGILGKRTRFQQSEISQLVLNIKRLVIDDENDRPTSSSNYKQLYIPKNLGLEDEAVMDKIIHKGPSKQSSLTPLDQCLLLGLCHHLRKNKEGTGSIIKEEMIAYVNCILEEPRSWCIQASTLFLRSKWETDSMRYLLRAIQQLEELVSQFERESKCNIHRLQYIYSSLLPPNWIIKHVLGTLLKKVGSINSALEVFESIQDWEEVIKCHTALGNKNKADVIIREQLTKKETPLLYCYLGDVTKDKEYYEKAWELSGKRFSRAQRSLAFWYIGKQQFEESLPYFEKSLEINPLQIGTSFTYGCTCLTLGQYDKAAIGFRKCVNLDSDNYEAWTNLAAAYIRAHNKPRAFLVLQEAIKCNYENWRIWGNYLLVSLDVGHFEETIRAYHRLLDLRQKHTDVEVLTVLVKVVKENLKDASGEAGIKLKSKIQTLFGHITSKVTNNDDIWILYAQLISIKVDDCELTTVDHEKILQYLQKAHRCSLLQTSGWERNINKSIEISKKTLDLIKAYQNCINASNDNDHKMRIISSCKLAVNAVLVNLQKNQSDFKDSGEKDELNKFIAQLSLELNRIIELQNSQI